MKQLILNLNTGQTLLETVPVPQVGPGQVLIRTRRSLVSAGTERMLVSFGRASLLRKAREQPERVRQVLDKIRTDGLRPTLNAVLRRLDQPLPLGYCNAGEVIALGEGVTDLRIGQRVVSNGPHAEVVCVPRNLVAAIPDNVPDDEAAFTVAGAIGLQGIRLLNTTLGETIVVIGLGLVGLLTAELLRIDGCRVIGIELDNNRCALARQRGITAFNPLETDVVQAVMMLTGQVGADGVVITASSGADKILADAARMSRPRGRIVLVGVVDMHLSRADFQKKELRFQVSNSYGAGRYDESYEQQGHDYPLPYVRWTENRNFQAVLHLLATGQLTVRHLISEVVPLADSGRTYAELAQSTAIATLFSYPDAIDLSPTIQLKESRFTGGSVVVGMIGAGNFVEATLLPALVTAGLTPAIIASAGGLSAARLGRKFGITQATSAYRQILDDSAINLCVIATRHDTHAILITEALQAGKHVFVQKPLALHSHELPNIIEAQQTSGRTVTVGFNRRFSPFVQRMKALLGGQASYALPMNVVATMNAGAVPSDSWVHNRAIGGGRLLGEACHLVDLITFLTGSRVVRVCLNAMGTYPTETTDSATLMLHYENGSTGSVHYFANGSPAYAKERVEVYTQGRTLVLDNYRTLRGFGFQKFSSQSGRQDKGHRALLQQLARQLRLGGEPPVPFAEAVNTTQAMLAALQSLRESCWVTVSTIGPRSTSDVPC